MNTYINQINTIISHIHVCVCVYIFKDIKILKCTRELNIADFISPNQYLKVMIVLGLYNLFVKGSQIVKITKKKTIIYKRTQEWYQNTDYIQYGFVDVFSDKEE